jgi:enoyl-CoA hydratase/carnithine racemase/predicted DNA-binding protein (MmcQ/YjbR family)
MSQKLEASDFVHTRYAVSGHVATLILDRPERRNALNYRAYEELEAALHMASRDLDVRCLIVTGADPAFCSGDDVREIMTGPANAESAARRATPRPTPAGQAALACECPIIAAVNGPAIGWGMELALFADIRIASEKAQFSEMFVKRGLVSDVGGFYRLPAIVGPSKAAELLFTGDTIDAGEALRIGLVGEVVPHAALRARGRNRGADRRQSSPRRARPDRGLAPRGLWRSAGDRPLGHRDDLPSDADGGSPRRRGELPRKARARIQRTLGVRTTSLGGAACRAIDAAARIHVAIEGIPPMCQDLSLGRRTAAVKARLDAKPGAVAEPTAAPRASAPSALIYKVMGKMFAILSIKGIEAVSLKCDPHLAETLRAQYSGVGHRYHLDRRHWISVSLDADVPAKEIERLIAHSYELVCAKLTRQQKTQLAARSP